MSNKTFNTLRFIQSNIIPLAEFISVLAKILGWDAGLIVAAILTGFNTFFGTFINNARRHYMEQYEDLVDGMGMTD